MCFQSSWNWVGWLTDPVYSFLDHRTITLHASVLYLESQFMRLHWEIYLSILKVSLVEALEHSISKIMWFHPASSFPFPSQSMYSHGKHFSDFDECKERRLNLFLSIPSTGQVEDHNCLWIDVSRIDIVRPRFLTLFNMTAVYEELKATGKFEDMNIHVDEAEHSMEMHLPYIAKVFEGWGSHDQCGDGFVPPFFIYITFLISLFRLRCWTILNLILATLRLAA